MKTLLLTLLLATLCATGYGQTIKALGYDTASGEVVYAGTNKLSFTNAVRLPLGGSSTQLALQISTNNTGFYTEDAAGNALIMVHNGSVAFGATTNQAIFFRAIGFSTTALAAATRTNLGLGGGIVTNISVLVSGGGTNTLQFSNGILTNVTTP
jgi:hypothetical protein